MKFIVDESVDYRIVIDLRNNGFKVISIMEKYPGVDDEKVLDLACKFESVLLTEDKDFGELAYRLRLKHRGILLLRLPEMSGQEISSYVTSTIKKYGPQLYDNFSVLNKNGLRIKITP